MSLNGILSFQELSRHPLSPALISSLSLSSVRLTFYPTIISQLGHAWLW